MRSSRRTGSSRVNEAARFTSDGQACRTALIRDPWVYGADASQVVDSMRRMDLVRCLHASGCQRFVQMSGVEATLVTE